MEIPLYIDGRQAGSFCMAQSGLYTLLEANADGCAQRLVRLWAHGEGGSAYLGVMQPWRGGLWLRRKLSRRELEHFPAPIAFVSDREREESEKSAEEETESLHNTETDYSACPWPAQPPEEGLLWYSRDDGSLTAFDGISSLLALPAELRAPDARAVERVIEGKKYLVFRY